MSSREAEVMECQRQIANRLARARSSAASSSASAVAAAASNKNNDGAATTMKKPPPPPSQSGPRKVVQQTAKSGGTSSSCAKSLASLAGLKPLTQKPASYVGSGTLDDPIVLDDGTNHGKNNLPHSKHQQKQQQQQQQQQQRRQKEQFLDNETESVLAYARQRVGLDKPKPNQQKRPALRSASITASQTLNTASSFKSASAAAIQSTISSAPAAPSSGSLASILLSNASTAKYLQPNAPKLLKHYDKIEPNDYWKNIKSWNFIIDLNEKMCNQKRDGKKYNDRGNGGTLQGKRKHDDFGKDNGNQPPVASSVRPLPDTFASYREYCALWAPLCLDEARAQILSGAIADIPHWMNDNNNTAKQSDKSPLRVLLEPLKDEVHGSSESMGVRVKNVLTPVYKDRSFMSNDIVLLVEKESYLWEAFNGTLRNTQQQQPSTRYGLVGHIEYSRKSIEGLTIQVSRKLWSEMRSMELVLFNLGCNITSLREFTALCRIDSIPLLNNILAGSMTPKKESIQTKRGASGSRSEEFDVIDYSAEEKRAKSKIISSMGGASALGKGFADYASRKFNLSQLGAISAAAQEYGNGGFTLIKGPPGTGKVS